MPRFVVLEHDHPHLHWDFLLEQGETLRAWRLAHAPEPGLLIAAQLLADHRPHYLDYEGPVSGGRGVVRRWDRGDYDPREAAAGRLSIELRGSRLQGTAVLARQAADEWSFQFISS